MHEFLQLTILLGKAVFKTARVGLYLGLGLISPLIKVIYLEFSQAIFNGLVIYSWFLACGVVYPVVNIFWVKAIHLMLVLCFMYQQGLTVFQSHRMEKPTKTNSFNFNEYKKNNRRRNKKK